jgi:uncharacterized protein YyaL (SSP411 family)
MPAFAEVLRGVLHAWQGDRKEIHSVSERLSEHLRESSSWSPPAGAEEIRIEDLQTATRAIRASYDWQYGGWGRAPKFPQPMTIEFLLRQATRGDEHSSKVAMHALDAMVRGGMYDVIGGGFHRYSTDDQWLVPHFEKMLYDNAQLALVYLHAYLLTGDEEYRRTTTETLDFLVRELRHPQGGFFSSLDADVEGEEGTTYLWTPDQLSEALTDAQARTVFKTVYPISKHGNFEGKNVLQRARPWNTLAEELQVSAEDLRANLDGMRAQLFEARVKRPQPHVDDKVLVSWNGLALRAFAEAGRYLQRPDYLLVAQQNARFLLDHLLVDGNLLRSWRAGSARHTAFLEDYAALILGLLALYQTDGDVEWFRQAAVLTAQMVERYSDPKGGFFDSAADARLLLRPKETQDNATPSGNSLAAHALLAMAALDERPEWHERVTRMFQTVREPVLRYPTAFAHWLQAFDFALGPVKQIAVVTPGPIETALPHQALIWKAYRPRTVMALSSYPPPTGSPRLLDERKPVDDQPTVFLCEGFICLRPTTDLQALQTELES